MVSDLWKPDCGLPTGREKARAEIITDAVSTDTYCCCSAAVALWNSGEHNSKQDGQAISNVFSKVMFNRNCGSQDCRARARESLGPEMKVWMGTDTAVALWNSGGEHSSKKDGQAILNVFSGY